MGRTQQMSIPGLEPRWTLGDRLRKAREIAGLTQTEMAEQIGIARNSVGRYESGDYEPSRPVLIAWAFRTGVSLSWIMGEEYDSGSHITALMRDQQPGYTEVRNDITAMRKALGHGERRPNARAEIAERRS
jgi:transcriptional regulator with XRE-family HTH domain